MLTAESDEGIRLVKNIVDLALSGMLDSIDIVGIQHRGGDIGVPRHLLGVAFRRTSEQRKCDCSMA